MVLQDVYTTRFVSIFMLQTHGKLMLVVVLALATVLQFDSGVNHGYGQAVCMVVGMVFIKWAHLVTKNGIRRASQIENAIQNKCGAEDAHQQNTQNLLRRAANARLLAQSCGFWCALKANRAADLQVRSIVKSVLCTVTETLTPRLFPCPPAACA
jgi:hypothetical protein